MFYPMLSSNSIYAAPADVIVLNNVATVGGLFGSDLPNLPSTSLNLTFTTGVCS